MHRNSLQLIFFFCFSIINIQAFSQDCACTISEVQNNTVTPCDITIGEEVIVTTTQELKNAIIQANNSGGNMTVLIADGTYQIASPSWYPYITASNVVFRSQSGNRDDVILTGTGMMSVAPGVENCLYAIGDNITIADLTIREVGNHGIAVQGDNLFVHNVKIQNTFEQMLKGTGGGDGADDALVQCSLFEYPAGIGPQFYIGGLDIHKGDNWLVRDNIFKNIQSPSGSLAEHAIHFWNNGSNNTIERNWIINCDRGIGFGLGSSPNEGGEIRNNMIYNDGTGIFNDVGIGLETSPNTKVYNNTIFLESYPNAIEYRFEATNNVLITNNLTNKLIKSRNGGQATLTTNITEAQSDWFVNVSEGDLHLLTMVPEVVDQGTELESVTDDLDQTVRPQGSGLDIGAHEFLQPQSSKEIVGESPGFEAYPNPAKTSFWLKSAMNAPAHITIYNAVQQEIVDLIWTPDSREMEISTAGWESGIYYCKATTFEGQTEVIKVVVLQD